MRRRSSNAALPRVVAGIAVASCVVLVWCHVLPDASRRPAALTLLGRDSAREPAARLMRVTLADLAVDAAEKLRGHNLHRHARMRTDGHGVRHRGHTTWRREITQVDPDSVAAQLARRFDGFNRDETKGELREALSSGLFSATGQARKVPVREAARISALEHFRLPGPLASIPGGMLPETKPRARKKAKATGSSARSASGRASARDFKAKATQTTKLALVADGLSPSGVNVGYSEDRVEYVPRKGGALMYEGGVHTGEEGAWEGEAHPQPGLDNDYLDEQVPIEAMFSGNFGVMPSYAGTTRHPDGFTVNKYWSPLFGARAPRGTAGRQQQLAQLAGVGVDEQNGIAELTLDDTAEAPDKTFYFTKNGDVREAVSSASTVGVGETRDGPRQRVVQTPRAAGLQVRDAARLDEESNGPVNGGPRMHSARKGASAMEDGGVTGTEKSMAMRTLQAAMADSRQDTPGHVEHGSLMTGAEAHTLPAQQPYESYYAYKWRIAHA